MAPVLVLFDIDGTLIDAGGAGRAAIESALLAVYGTAGPIDELPFDGLTDPLIAHTLLGEAGLARDDIEAKLEALWGSYLAHLRDELAARRRHLSPLPGSTELLDSLAECGATLGLVTGNIAEGAHQKLGACALDGRFTFGGFGSDALERNELPPIAMTRAHESTGVRFEADSTWIIGDTPRDIECAHASGLRVLAVATGRFSVAELKLYGADRVMSSLADTGRVMAELTTDSRARRG